MNYLEEFGTMGGTKYRNVPAVLVTPEDVTQEELAPMCSKSIPSTTESAIEFDGDIAFIPLRSKNLPGLFAVVDREDVPQAVAYKWHPVQRSGCLHVRRSYREGDKVRTAYLHTHILGSPPQGMVIDHINGDGLDNRKSNLRFATHQENTQNRRVGRNSEFKGSKRTTRGKPWAARIIHDGKCQFLGTFLTSEEAARAYDRAAKNLFGEFACLNFPEEEA